MKKIEYYTPPHREVLYPSGDISGKMIDGQWSGIPYHREFNHLYELNTAKYWLAHAAVDVGYRAARRNLADLNMRVKHLARAAGRHGWHISVHGIPSFDFWRPPSIEVWIIDEMRIVCSLKVTTYDCRINGQTRDWKKPTYMLRDLCAGIAKD